MKFNSPISRRTAALSLCVATVLVPAAPGHAAFPDQNVPPSANDDGCSTQEETPVGIPVVDNDSDPDNVLSVTEIDGQPVSAGASVTVGGGTGTVSIETDRTLTFTPGEEVSGTVTFDYTVAEMVASGPAGLSYHLESTSDNGPLLFILDLTSGEKTFIGALPFGGSTAMAYDEVSGLLYFIRGNGDLYGYDPTTPTSSATLVGNIESSTDGWTDPVPTAFSHQTGSFYEGSLYLVPTARPTPAVDDALFRVDFDGPTDIADVVRVADMSSDTVEWNNNDDIAVDPVTGILYGRSDTNDRDDDLRSSYFYSYDLASGEWTVIAEELDYFRDFTDASNNPDTWGDFRDASIGLSAHDGAVFGTDGAGAIGEIDSSTGAWTVLGTFAPDDGDLTVGGDLAHNASYLRTATATVTCSVEAVNDPPVAVDDSTSTSPGEPVTIDPLAGTGAGSDSDPDSDIDPTSVTLLTPEGASAGDGGTVTVDGVGTWMVNEETGEVTFTPAEGFAGVASIRYTIADEAGSVSEPATITVEVAGSQATVPSTSVPSTTEPSTTVPSTTVPSTTVPIAPAPTSIPVDESTTPEVPAPAPTQASAPSASGPSAGASAPRESFAAGPTPVGRSEFSGATTVPGRLPATGGDVGAHVIWALGFTAAGTALRGVVRRRQRML